MPLAFESVEPNNPVVGDIILGNVVQMDGIDWRVVHIDTNAGECVLAKEYWEENVRFDSGNSTTYNGSDIMGKCDVFLLSLSSETRKALVTKTVHGVERKIWIPQSNWISSSQPYGSPPAGSWTGTNVFQYFTDNDSRIYKDEGGTAKYWWTSSPNDSDHVWTVYTSGFLYDGGGPPSVFSGFRPFCAVFLT